MRHPVDWRMVAIGVVGILICAVIRYFAWNAKKFAPLSKVEAWLTRVELTCPWRFLLCRIMLTICFMLSVIWVLAWSMRAGIVR